MRGFREIWLYVYVEGVACFYILCLGLLDVDMRETCRGIGIHFTRSSIHCKKRNTLKTYAWAILSFGRTLLALTGSPIFGLATFWSAVTLWVYIANSWYYTTSCFSVKMNKLSVYFQTKHIIEVQGVFKFSYKEFYKLLCRSIVYIFLLKGQNKNRHTVVQCSSIRYRMSLN